MNLTTPEFGTDFHKWYKERFGRSLEMSYTEIHKSLSSEEGHIICEVAEMYDRHFQKERKKLFNSELNVLT